MDDYFNDYADEKMYGRTASKEADQKSQRSYVRGDHFRNHKNEAFYAIERILSASVGQNWNDVSQKIFKSVKCLEKGYIEHVFEWKVELHTTLDNKGNVLYHESHPWRMGAMIGLHPIVESTSELYVHPTTFILHKNIKPKKVQPKVPPTVYFLGDYKELRKINGIWYLRFLEEKDIERLNKRKAEQNADFRKLGCTMYFPYDPFPSKFKKLDEPSTEGIMRNLITWTKWYESTPTIHKIKIHKQQLSSKELKQFNLKND